MLAARNFFKVHLVPKFNYVSLGERVCLHSVRQLYASCQLRMKLQEVVTRLETFAAPSLAASWDNVGLLVEPSQSKEVHSIMLTNDLTMDVMEECIQDQVDLIVSYHPPIFKPLLRLTSKNWKERIVLLCFENRIALYSPHTAFDAVNGGVNDWLISPFGSSANPIEEISPGVGYGRYIILDQPLSLDVAVKMVKKHLQLPYVRLATPFIANQETLEVSSIAVCAGSGASVLKTKRVSLWITGEMSHHEVLDAIHNGTAVILCEHSNTERGFLKAFAGELSKILNDQVKVKVSSKDCDPLRIV